MGLFRTCLAGPACLPQKWSNMPTYPSLGATRACMVRYLTDGTGVTKHRRMASPAWLYGRLPIIGNHYFYLASKKMLDLAPCMMHNQRVIESYPRWDAVRTGMLNGWLGGIS